MITFEIDTEYIELIKLLKATRIADSGAMAKILVEMERLPAMENPNSANVLKSPKEKSSPLWDKA